MLTVTCPKFGRLYPLQMMNKTHIQALFALGVAHIDPTMLWQHQFGHLNSKAMRTGQVDKLFEGIPTNPDAKDHTRSFLNVWNAKHRS